MATIEIASHVALPHNHTYSYWTGVSLAEVQAEFEKRYPWYSCPAVYWHGNHFWFVMEWYGA